MASFVSNKRTRTTEKAIHQKCLYRNILSTTGAPAVDDTKFLGSGSSAPRTQAHVVTTIGSSNSKGLSILGYRADLDSRFPRNPGETEEPFGRFSPSFPVSYSGTGYLDFINGFAVPYIIGSTEIKGNLLVTGSITVKNSGGSGSTPVAFSPVVKDALDNTLTVTSTKSLYKTMDSVDYFEICIEWSDSALATDEAVRIEGFPLSTYSPHGYSPMVPSFGVYTKNVGASIYGNVPLGTNYMQLTESDSTSSNVRATVKGDQFEGVTESPGGGSFCISGWLAKI